MGKYFGTDGFRGEANCTLTADHAFKVGRFLGWYYGQLKLRAGLDEPARIIIGKDTRRSSYMLEYSLVGGVNDTEEDARELTALAKPLCCHINLIPVNPIKERDYVQSDTKHIQAFKN